VKKGEREEVSADIFRKAGTTTEGPQRVSGTAFR